MKTIKRQVGSYGNLRSVSWLTALLTFGGLAASASEYELGPQDRVRITVVEWTLDELRSPISGEYTVGAGGDISLPLLGTVRASGMPISKFSALVSDLLQKKLELSQRPNTSIEMVQFRPFYIIGEITNPGEFAYRPGMTVLQAVSLAGGFPRPTAGPLQIERDVISEEASIAVSLAEIDGLIARQSRLQAELTASDTTTFPEEILTRQKSPEIMKILSAEETIFNARRGARTRIEGSKAKFAELFNQEQEALKRHSEALSTQLASAQTQLKMLRGMKERGLASPTRELDLERIVSEIQAKLWDVDTQVVRSRREFATLQEANDHEVSRIRQQIADEMSQTTTRLNELRNRADASQDLIALTRLYSSLDPSARYTIVREDPQGNSTAIVEIDADEHTKIKPGDVLKVTIERDGPRGRPTPPPLPDVAVSSREKMPVLPLSDENARNHPPPASRGKP